MLYDNDVEFNGKKYKNTFCLLDSLIIDGTLKLTTIDEKSSLLNILDKEILSK